jgi:glycosyltransferase involved in cell wall biosynthesis
MLLAAWKRIRPQGWTLEIAGSGEPRHEAEVRDIIRRLQLHEVSLVGDLRGVQKWRFLANADLFVLPTFSENFGVAIAEAMAAGIPVITTRGTPWRALRDERMGWWIDADEHALATALREATSEPLAALHDRGQRARHYAMKTFGWPAIGQRMMACYEWVLGIGPATQDIEFA